jgi:hypothetical protein
MIRVPIGDVVDRITILEVKLELMSNQLQLTNVSNELESLRSDLEISGVHVEQHLLVSLREVNRAIFLLMDEVFKFTQVDLQYARVAKETVDLNVARARLKREINLLSQSSLVEEKTFFEEL